LHESNADPGNAMLSLAPTAKSRHRAPTLCSSTLSLRRSSASAPLDPSIPESPHFPRWKFGAGFWEDDFQISVDFRPPVPDADGMKYTPTRRGARFFRTENARRCFFKTTCIASLPTSTRSLLRSSATPRLGRLQSCCIYEDRQL